MKKIELILLVLLLLPFNVLALKRDYETMDLESVFKEEEIEYDFSNYKETNDMVKIYLFRGKGCEVCHSFLEFISSIIPEYGKYFKVISYEVFYNENNYKLLNDVALYQDEILKGVPYIIIGDKVFNGYTDSYQDEIKKIIKEQYESKNKYDIFKEMEKSEKEKNFSLKDSTILITSYITCNTIIIILYNNYKFKKILKK